LCLYRYIVINLFLYMVVINFSLSVALKCLIFQIMIQSRVAAREDPSELHAYVVENLTASEECLRFHCQICGRAGANRRDVRNHVESVHFPNVFEYVCAVCGIKLSSRKSLDNHKYRHHKTNKD
jgi:hypothetical protein